MGLGKGGLNGEAGFLLRAGTRVIYPAMTLHVPGYRPDGRSFFSVTSQ